MSALPVLAVPLILLLATPAFADPVTNAPYPTHGRELTSRLCSNCHLVGSGQQEQTNADVPSFHEIAEKQGQTADAIMAHIMLPSTRCRPFRSPRASLQISRLI
jgi:hypothetical protein